MLGRGAAATANQPDSGIDEALHEIRHVLRGAQVNVAALHRAGNAGVRLGGQRRGGDRSHALQRILHGHRADAAVTANHVGAPGLQLRSVMFGTGAIQAIALFVDGHLRHHRQIGIHIASGQQRLMQLFQVAEGFQDHQVNAFFIERGNLLAKGVARLGERDFAQRLDAHAQRTDRACDQGVKALGRLPGQTRSLAVDLHQFIQTSVLGQAKRIGAEGVCFNNLGAGLQVFLMNAADQIGRRQVQFVVATIDENAFGVQQRTHGAIA